MLAKLMKYEMPALGRRLGPLYLAWIATAIFLGIIAGHGGNLPGIIQALSGLLYGLVSAAVVIMTVILVIQRYNTSLFGDGGYFSHALPVGAGTHIMNKVLSATIWTIISGIVALLTGLIIAFTSGVSITEAFHAMGYFFGQIDGRVVILIIEVFLLCVLSIGKSILAIYTAIAIGHQPQKHNVLCSIGAYILVLMFEGSTGGLIGTVTGMYDSDLFNFTSLDQFITMQIFVAIAAAVTIAYAAIYFFLTRWLMTKRLNLQ